MNGASYKKNSNTFKFQRMRTFSTVRIKKIKKFKMCTVKKKYVNQSFPHNSKTKRDIAKISSVLKPMKSDYNVIKCGENRSKFNFLGVKGLKNVENPIKYFFLNEEKRQIFLLFLCPSPKPFCPFWKA